MTSQDTGGTGFPGARAAARSAGRVRTWSPRWLPASPGRNARGRGATGGGSCVLHVGRAFVQYAQPLASTPPPSWSRPSRGRAGRRCVDATGTRDRGQVERMGPEVPGPTTKTPRSRSRQQPSVHSADTNGPDVDAHSGDRWNSAGCSSGFDVGVVLMSAPWTPTLRRVSFIGPPSPPGQPPHPGFPPERASQK